MRYLDHLPDEFKEKVSIYRIDAVTRRRTDVASDVVCWLEPDTSQSGNQIVLENGVAVKYTLYTAHLEAPISDIQEGDHVERIEKGSEKLRVFSIRPYGNDVMQLVLRARGVL